MLNTLLTILFLNSVLAVFATEPPIMATLHGVVKDGDGTPLPYTTIYINGTSRGVTADDKGRYSMVVDVGEVDVVVQMLGYATKCERIAIRKGQNEFDVTLEAESKGIEEVVVEASGVGRLRRSAFNAVAVDTRALQNSTKSISDALSRAPGIKLRETGGVAHGRWLFG